MTHEEALRRARTALAHDIDEDLDVVAYDCSSEKVAALLAELED